MKTLHNEGGPAIADRAAASADTATAQAGPRRDIYIIAGGVCRKYEPGTVTDAERATCTAVGIACCGCFLSVALHDLDKGRGTALTEGPCRKGGVHMTGCLEAGSDWDGRGNTERLRTDGLRPAATPGRGMWIPSIAELRLLSLFRADLNQALEEAGGDPLEPDRYWSSTERGEATAWSLNMGYGSMGHGSKTDRHRIRPVGTF